MVVKTVSSEDEFNRLIDGDKPVVVDWFATWCGPCKYISPLFERLSDEVEGIEFVAVDVDEASVGSKLASAHHIRAMPTFHVYRKKDKVAEITGANHDNLRKLIDRFKA